MVNPGDPPTTPVNGDVPAGLIRLEPVLELVRLAIWTAKIESEKPVSLILVAEQESAKSQALLHFRNTPTLRYLDDLTSKGIVQFKHDIESGVCRHIVLTDMVRIISHGRNVTDRTIQTLSALIEEGQSATADAGGMEKWKDLPSIGILTAVTPSFFRSKQGKWRSTGFMSRFLPVYFDYSMETVEMIHTMIRAGSRLPDPIAENLPTLPVPVELSDELADLVQARAVDWGSENYLYGFRHHRQLRTLLKAAALHDHCTGQLPAPCVTLTHVKRLLALHKFFRYREPIHI